MKVCFVSDLHVDFNQPPIIWPEADLLVIAGDTANTIGGELKLLRTVSQRYSRVLTVDGNHTHYANKNQKRTIEETLDRLEAQLPENVTLLSRSEPVKLGNYYFVGRNGWYSMDSSGDPMNNRLRWKEEMNDCRWIGFDSVSVLEPQPWDLAETHAEELRAMIESVVSQDAEARFIVVTHTAPHRASVSQRPEHMHTNPFYINTKMQPVMEDYADRIELWHHGHTHERSDRTIDGVYVLVNPRGYPGENSGWEPVVIDL